MTDVVKHNFGAFDNHSMPLIHFANDCPACQLCKRYEAKARVVLSAGRPSDIPLYSSSVIQRILDDFRIQHTCPIL